MIPPRASVVVVSRGRPDTLRLCLLGLSRLIYPAFEVIVVACPAGIAAAQSLSFAAHLKLVTFDEPNISAARNLGIAQTAGDITAFIDDDAVPEPTWLHHLAKGFALPDVACVGGYVRGRNGISYQWTARSVDTTGFASSLKIAGDAPVVPVPVPGHVVKTEGTNMALRTDLLRAMGGFDPAFRFYLDETDLNMRLAARGLRIAIAPLAEVHHAYAPSPRRAANRGIRDLTEIGASQAVFLRKYHPTAEQAHAIAALTADQHRRALAHMVDGRIEPGDVAPVLASFERGLTQGMARPLADLPPIAATPLAFAAFPALATGTHHLLAGRIWSRSRLRRQAAELAKAGHTVTVMVFTHTFLAHRLRFEAAGFWYQYGGLWGRSDRAQPAGRSGGVFSRARREMARVQRVRTL